MLKRLTLKYWPLGVFLILIVAILGMSRYAERRKETNQDNARQSSPAASVAPDDTSKTGKNTDKPKNPPSWIDTFAWPEGVTTWALILTLFVIAWQSAETRAAAEAGLKQANHVVASERAWMIPKISQPKYRDVMEVGDKPDGWYLPIQVTLTNRGKTPAVIISGLLDYSSEFTVDPKGVPLLEPNLPEIVNYIKEVTKYSPGSVYVPEDKTTLIRTIPRDFLLRENASWRSGQKMLCVKGFMEYQDAFKETRISRFCYAYQIIQAGGGFTDEITGEQIFPAGFEKAGPGSYNEKT